MSLSLQLLEAAPIVADVEVEDQSTKTKRPMRLELNAASISLTPTNGGEKLAWPIDIVQRPNPGGGGPFGKGLADPFYISVAVNVNGFQDDPAQMTLYFGTDKSLRDKVLHCIATASTSPGAHAGAAAALPEPEPQEETIRAAGVTMRALTGSETGRETRGMNVELAPDVLLLSSEGSDTGDGLRFEIRMSTIIHLEVVNGRPGNALSRRELHGLGFEHRVVEDESALPAKTLLEFGEGEAAKVQRDRFVITMRRRASAAALNAGKLLSSPHPSSAGSPGSPRGSLAPRPVSKLAPKSVRIVAVTTPKDFSVYVLECTSAESVAQVGSLPVGPHVGIATSPRVFVVVRHAHAETRWVAVPSVCVSSKGPTRWRVTPGMCRSVTRSLTSCGSSC